MWKWERGETGVQPLPADSQGGSQRGEQRIFYHTEKCKSKAIIQRDKPGETDRQEDRETGQIDSAGP